MSHQNMQIEFALIGIQTLEFALLKELYSECNNQVGIKITVDFQIKSIEDHEMVCMPEVYFIQEEKPFIKLKTACHFSVKPEQWNQFVHPEKGVIIFPKGFTDHLLMLSLGTLRGILHAKTEGTIFNRFFLPTINVTTFSEKDLELKIDSIL